MGNNRRLIRNWLWFCPPLMLGLAAAVLMLWGLSVWTAVIVVTLLVCPVIILWGAVRVIRRK